MDESEVPPLAGRCGADMGRRPQPGGAARAGLVPHDHSMGGAAEETLGFRYDSESMAAAPGPPP